MLESIALAEGTVTNLPAWVAWVAVILAITLPAGLYFWLTNQKTP